MKIATNRVYLGGQDLELEVNALEDLDDLEVQLRRARGRLQGLPPEARLALQEQLQVLERELECQQANQERRRGKPGYGE